MVCPHAVIRAKIYGADLGDKAPVTFKWAKPKWKGMEQERYTLQAVSYTHLDVYKRQLWSEANE